MARDQRLSKQDEPNRPEEYSGYFEDLTGTPDTEIGPKGFFETASNVETLAEQLKNVNNS
jgi:hypothetical protein